jgi:hypothetical protein
LNTEAEKIDRIGAVFSSLEGVAANAKAEIERLQMRRRSAEQSAERLERYVLAALRNRDGKPLRGNNVTFSTRRSESLIVDDAAVVPAEWKQITANISIPKDPLRRAIKGGIAIPGCHIEERLNLVRK